MEPARRRKGRIDVRMQPSTLGLVVAGAGAILLGVLGIGVLAGRQNDPTQQATDFSAIPAPVHYAAPTLALSDLSGAGRQLADYRGQVVLINLWATWCPPCQAEMPLLQQFFNRYRDHGFTVIAIEDGDPTGDVRSFVARYRLTFPIWLDPAHQATDHAFKTINLPASFVVDRAGEVRLMWLGAINESNLEKYITPLIEER